MYLKQNTISQLHTNKHKQVKQIKTVSQIFWTGFANLLVSIFHIDLKYKNKYGVKLLNKKVLAFLTVSIYFIYNGDGCTTVHTLKTTELYILNGWFVWSCELYLNKVLH